MKPDENFEGLLAAAAEGTLSSEEREALNIVLHEHPEMIDQAICFLIDDELLRTELSIEENDLSLRQQVPTSPIRDRRGPCLRWWVGAAAALIAFFLLGKWHESLPAEEVGVSISAVKQSDKPIAQLTRGYSLSFKEKELGVGDYQIAEGTAEILFRNGVEVILDAPADFTIENEMKMVLREGRVRARVPEQITGFTIDAPDLDIVDLGTEFGVYVERDKKTEVHVFSGEVELHEKDGTPSSVRVIKEGAAENWVNGRVSELLPQPDSESFSSSAEIGFRRWKEHQQHLLRDPSLLVFWDFQGGAVHPDRVLNRRGDSRYHGFVRGAKIVSGRWANKKALLFDDPEDRVNIHLPDPLSEFTLSAWIKVDSFQSPVVALLNSNGLPPQSVHWQLRDRGGLRVSAQGVFYGSSSHTYVQPGEWTHVAMSYHAQDQRLRVYVNGEIVMRRRSATSDSVVFGKANLGHWAKPTYWPYERSFKGRIGELLVFNEQKSEEDLRVIYETGKP